MTVERPEEHSIRFQICHFWGFEDIWLVTAHTPKTTTWYLQASTHAQRCKPDSAAFKQQRIRTINNNTTQYDAMRPTF
jgi:hypothetical protein